MRQFRKAISVFLLTIMLWSFVPFGAVEAKAAGNADPNKTWFWPTGENSGYWNITSTHGWRDYGGLSLHRGIDISPRGGTEIFAAADGFVYEEPRLNGTWGYTIVIAHNEDPIGDGDVYFTRYSHLKEGSILVSKGDSVKRGQHIATMGNTGKAGGVHLDFTIYHKYFDVGCCTDPAPKFFNGVDITELPNEIKKIGAYPVGPENNHLHSDPASWRMAYTTTKCNHEQTNKETGDCPGCGLHFHQYNENGYCKKTSCKDDYLNTSEYRDNEEPYFGTLIAKTQKQPLDPKIRPYQAASTCGICSLQMEVVARVKNHQGDIWYKVKCSTNQYGYIYSRSGSFDFKSKPAYVNVNVTTPAKEFQQGKAQNVSGTITSLNPLQRVKLGIYNQDGSQTSYVLDKSPNTTTYTMSNSDNLALKFSQLPGGKSYYYLAEGWDNQSGGKSDASEGHYGSKKFDFFVNPKVAQTVYTVKFDPNGGYNAPDAQRVAKGGSISFAVIGVPERFNYKFLGWSADSTADTPDYLTTSSVVPQSDMTLYAVWQELLPPNAPTMTDATVHIGVGKTATVSWNVAARAQSYTATAYDAGGVAVTSNTVSGTATSLLFSAAGTYTVRIKANNTVGSSSDSTNMLTVVVHDPSVVTFEDYDGTVYATQTVGYGEAAAVPNSPTRKGYTFSRWDGSLTNVRENRTLNAVYTPIEYTVKFYGCDGALVKTEKVTYDGDTPGTATPPEKSELHISEGYAFAGWDSNCYQSVTESCSAHASQIWANADVPLEVEITSVEEAGEGYWVYYTVTNHVDSAKAGRIVVVLKSNFGKFLTKTESGAFYLSAGDGSTYQGNQYVPLTGALADEMFTTVEAYAVNNYQTLQPISAPDTYNVLSVDGDWSSWMTDEELANFKYSYTDTQSKTEYRTNTRSVSDWMTNSSYSDWARLDSRTVKTDWSGWSDWQDKAESTDADKEVQTRQIQTSSAYTEYRYGHIIGRNVKGAQSGKSYSVVSSPSMRHFNYNYIGTGTKEYSSWSTTRYGADSMRLVSTLYDDNTYYQISDGYAYWHIYYLGSTAAADKYFWEESRTIPATYKTQYRYRTRSNVDQYRYYKWNGWSAWSDKPATANENLKVETRNMTRVKLANAIAEGNYTMSGSLGVPEATGKQAIFTVYKVDEASDYSNQYMEQVVLGEDGAYEFVFNPLSEPTVASGDYTAVLTMEGSSVPVYVGTIKAPKPVYSVEFIDGIDGSRIGDVENVEEGSAAVAPDVPEHEGYTFIGWEYGLTNIRDNMTISARYSPKHYTVVFIDWANYSVSIQTDVPHGSQLIPPEVIAPDGYNFIGWEASEGFDLDCINGSMVVNAVYEAMQYKVRFLDGLGNIISEQTVNHGESAVAPEIEDVDTPENMYVLGWNTTGYEQVCQPMDILPELYYEEDAELPELSLEPGIYEGPQTLAMSCADSEAVITYSVLSEEGLLTEYEEPIEISESTVLSVSVSKANANTVTETLEYIIVPKDSVPAAPKNIALSTTEEAIMLTWDAAAGAKGYIIEKTDFYGGKERFMVEGTSYEDKNVSSMTDYSYQIGSYAMIETGDGNVFVESNEKTDAGEIRFFGSNVPVSKILINLPERVVLGNTVPMPVAVEPFNAFDRSVIWAVEPGTGKAVITQSGYFTGVAAGTVTIKAYANDESGAEASKVITIVEKEEQSLPIRIDSATTSQGKEIDISISVDENIGASVLQFAVEYDPTVLHVKNAVGGKMLEGKEPTINFSENGVIYFNWDDTSELNGEGSLLDIIFEVDGNAPASDTLISILDDAENEFLCARLVGDTYEDIDCEVFNGVVTIIDLNLGDVNGDGSINVIDANIIRRFAAHMVTLSAQEALRADVDGSGTVNVVDANLIRRYVARIIREFPVA